MESSEVVFNLDTNNFILQAHQINCMQQPIMGEGLEHM